MSEQSAWVVVGAGGMATNIVDSFNLKDWGFSHYFDTPRKADEMLYGFMVNLYAPKGPFYISVIGDPREKRNTLRLLESKLPEPDYGQLIHYDTFIAHSAEIGYDVVIQPMTNIYSRVKIGNHALICGGSRIGHDTVIGDYCTLSPEVAIGGNCKISDGVFLGLNCTVRDETKIGKGAVIGAGAVVVRDVPENWIVVGNPARHLKGADHW